MIKLPKNVNNVMKTLGNAGFECYVVGGCVRDSLLGENPLDWDIATAAKLEDLIKLFPEAKVLSEKYSVLRMDFTDDEEDEVNPIVDIATYRLEGKYTDFVRPDEVTFIDSIEDDMKRRDFTINAMADNPQLSFVDPYNGKKDIENKLIRCIGDPKEKFEENPIRMLRAIRLASENGFDLTADVYEAMVEKAHLLEKCGVDAIREEFCRIMVGKATGKALRMLAGAELMPYIIGHEATKVNVRQRNQFAALCDRVDETQPVLERRLGLFYTTFEGKKGYRAMERLNYSKDIVQSVSDGLFILEKLYFIKFSPDLKKLLVEIGMDRYSYLDNLDKAQRIIYQSGDEKIMNRYYIVKGITENKEPVYVEDLAINGDDLIEAGICKGEEIGKILLMLTDKVHIKPFENEKDILLKYAKKFKKNKFAATTRRVKWMK